MSDARFLCFQWLPLFFKKRNEAAFDLMIYSINGKFETFISV